MGVVLWRPVVEELALEAHREHARLPAKRRGESRRQLEFLALAQRRRGERIEHRGGDDVAPEHRQVRCDLQRLGLLLESSDAQCAPDRLADGDAEALDLVRLVDRGGYRVELTPKLWASYDEGLAGGFYLHDLIYRVVTRANR